MESPPVERAESVLVLDFDNTVTVGDVGDQLCDVLAPPEWRAIDEEWVKGGLSLPEAQRRIWRLARASREEAVAAARRVVSLRPGLDELLEAAEARGAQVWIASGGFDFYVEALLGGRPGRLARLGRIACNRMRFDEGRRMTPEFPHAELSCGRCAVCKARVCEEARRVAARVAFAGDGHSDRCVVEGCDGTGRAAAVDRLAAVRGTALARCARERGVEALEFDRLDELVPLLG